MKEESDIIGSLWIHSNRGVIIFLEVRYHSNRWLENEYRYLWWNKKESISKIQIQHDPNDTELFERLAAGGWERKA